MNTWYERVRDAILDAPSPAIIVAGEEWGVPRLVAGLRDPEQPLIWVDLREVDCDDDIAVGNEISEAIRRGLGSSLFGLGVGVEYAVGALEAYVPALEPLTVAVTGSERRPSLIQRFSAVLQPPNSLVVHVAARVNVLDDIDGAYFIREDQLRITIDEAIRLYGLDRDPVDIAEAVDLARGAIVTVEEVLHLDNVDALGDEVNSDRAHRVTPRNSIGVVDALIGRRRWIDAFEFAVDHAPTKIGEVLDEAGNAYFERGHFNRFWRYLSVVPRWALRGEQSMYWLFNAAMAVNQWRTLLPMVDRYLQSHEAPELRSRRAASQLSGDSIGEAKMAHQAKRTPETARALAFICQFRGELDMAADLYREALELAEAAGRPRHIVAASTGMAQVHLFAGRYERAQRWGAWAVQQHRGLGLGEELLRITATSVCGYARILVGAVHRARQVLETVRVRESMVGIPMMEGVISTLGDLSMAEGNYDEAVSWYRMNLDGASHQMYGSLANDLVLAYLLKGQVDEAMVVAAEAGEISRLSSEYQQTIADLALGCAMLQADSHEGEELLRSALGRMRIRPMGPHRAQGALHLGRYLLRQGRSEEARRLLEEHSEFIAELGDSGWLLLGGNGPQVMQLKRMFRVGEPEIELQLLGKRRLRNQGVDGNLSLRLAELLAMLAASPNGIRAEALGLALYGDRANMSTLKATVSRARKLVPIESQPYRIGEACRTDVIHVMELLRTGKVQAALELYRGPLLPESDAPGVVELRGHLEESVRQAVLASGDPDAMIDLAGQQGDDLELWEETRRHLAPNDPRRPLASARIRRIRKRWRSEGG